MENQISIKITILIVLIYSIVLLFTGGKIRQHFEHKCEQLKIAETNSNEQGSSEKGVDKYVEETVAPDGTKIKRTGEKKFSASDYLKNVEIKTITVEIPAPPPDNIIFKANSKLQVGVDINFAPHYWGGYKYDIPNSENIYEVGYSIRLF